MSWGGKGTGSGLTCITCGFHNHHSNPSCASVACHTWRGNQMKGWTEGRSERPQGQGWQSQGKGH
eukprot:4505652-Heterocapsa_arctica.AAC.1